MADLYSMKLHECLIVDSPYMQVTRVPGGWVYLLLNVNEIPNATAVFVPFHNEFQNGPERYAWNELQRTRDRATGLMDGCGSVLGLIELIRERDDLTPELREVLSSNHRIAEAEAALVAWETEAKR
jgi:hypothetical protein